MKRTVDAAFGVSSPYGKPLLAGAALFLLSGAALALAGIAPLAAQAPTPRRLVAAAQPRQPADSATVVVALSALGLERATPTDLWTGRELEPVDDSVGIRLAPHASALLRLRSR